jgi:hypothetical protein
MWRINIGDTNFLPCRKTCRNSLGCRKRSEGRRRWSAIRTHDLVVTAWPHGQTVTPLHTPALENLTAVARCHTSQKPVLTQPPHPLGLVGSFHKVQYLTVRSYLSGNDLFGADERTISPDDCQETAQGVKHTVNGENSAEVNRDPHREIRCSKYVILLQLRALSQSKSNLRAFALGSCCAFRSRRVSGLVTPRRHFWVVSLGELKRSTSKLLT